MNINSIIDKIDLVKITLADNQQYESRRYKITDKITNIEFKADEKIYVKTPQEAVIGLITNEALYHANTTLLAAEYEDPFMSFLVQTPAELERQQIRSYFRVQTNEPAKIIIKNENDEKIIPCKVFDISASGVRLILEDAKEEVSDNVEIEIAFKEKTVKCGATLVRTQNIKKEKHVAFKFIEESNPKTIDYIAGFCVKNQLRPRKII